MQLLRAFEDRFTVSFMQNRMRSWTMALAVAAFAATCLPRTAARAQSHERTQAGGDLHQELDRLEQQRFEEQLRRARAADRAREAERARRMREDQERGAQAAERKREARETARAREEFEAASLQAAREADRERTAKRGRSQRDRHAPAPPSR